MLMAAKAASCMDRPSWAAVLRSASCCSGESRSVIAMGKWYQIDTEHAFEFWYPSMHQVTQMALKHVWDLVLADLSNSAGDIGVMRDESR